RSADGSAASVSRTTPRRRLASQALRTGHFQTVQVPFNPRERDCERVLLPLAAELGVAVIAMRRLGATGGLVAQPPASRELERWRENEREIVEHPGAVAIVAVDRGGARRARPSAPRAGARGTPRAAGQDAREVGGAARGSEARARGGDGPDRRALARARELLY